MSVPASNLVEKKPKGGFSSSRPRGIPVYLFCSTRGPTTAQTFGPRKHADIAAMYGAGGVRKACYMAAMSAGDCLCIRLPATARTASRAAATVVRNVLSDFTYTQSGTITDGGDIVIQFVAAAVTTGTTGITYQVSVNGGVDFGAITPLLTATSITVRGTAIALGSTKVVTPGDQILWFQRAASAAVLPQTLTKAGSSTATYAVTGTPAAAYRFRLEWEVGTTLGTTGGTYRYCFDWNGTKGSFTPAQQLGTGVTIQPLDGVEASGLTITLSTAGTSTVDANDFFEFNTTAPEASYADVAAALTALRAAKLTWSFLAVCTPLDAADTASLDSLLVGWASARRTWAVTETRDRETSETIRAWKTRLLADFVSFTSTRVFPAAGHAPAADSIAFQRPRFSALVDYVIRLATVPQISTDPGQVTLGALPTARTLYDATGQQVEYDADKDPGLFDAHGDGQGFLVLRTWEDEQLIGTYPAGGICMPSAGDLGLVQLRRVLDAFSDALQSAARLELVGKFRRWTEAQVANTNGEFKAGDIFEADARNIVRRLKKAGERAVKQTGDASGVTIILERTPTPINGGKFAFRYSGECAPLGYIYRFDGEASLVDPEA